MDNICILFEGQVLSIGENLAVRWRFLQTASQERFGFAIVFGGWFCCRCFCSSCCLLFFQSKHKIRMIFFLNSVTLLTCDCKQTYAIITELEYIDIVIIGRGQ